MSAPVLHAPSLPVAHASRSNSASAASAANGGGTDTFSGSAHTVVVFTFAKFSSMPSITGSMWRSDRKYRYAPAGSHRGDMSLVMPSPIAPVLPDASSRTTICANPLASGRCHASHAPSGLKRQSRIAPFSLRSISVTAPLSTFTNRSTPVLSPKATNAPSGLATGSMGHTAQVASTLSPLSVSPRSRATMA